MKRIKLNVHGIEVELGDPDPNTKGAFLGGSIKSDLPDDTLTDKNPFNIGMDTIESMILACVTAGIDIESPAFKQAIEETVDTHACRWGD